MAAPLFGNNPLADAKPAFGDHPIVEDQPPPSIGEAFAIQPDVMSENAALAAAPPSNFYPDLGRAVERGALTGGRGLALANAGLYELASPFLSTDTKARLQRPSFELADRLRAASDALPQGSIPAEMAGGLLSGPVAMLGAPGAAGQDVIARGGTPAQAQDVANIALASELPALALPGLGTSIPARVAAQGAAGGALSEVGRAGENAVLPADQQRPFDLGQLMAAIGGAGAFGLIPHAPEAPLTAAPDLAAAFREAVPPPVTEPPPRSALPPTPTPPIAEPAVAAPIPVEAPRVEPVAEPAVISGPAERTAVVAGGQPVASQPVLPDVPPADRGALAQGTRAPADGAAGVAPAPDTPAAPAVAALADRQALPPVEPPPPPPLITPEEAGVVAETTQPVEPPARPVEARAPEPMPAQGEAPASAGQPQTEGVASITKESVNASRQKRGLTPIENLNKISNEDALGEAQHQIAADPELPRRLIDSLIAEPRAANPVEKAVLAHDRQRIETDLRQAADEVAKAPNDGARAAAIAKRDLSDLDLELNDRATRATGTSSGQSLQSQKIAVLPDYTLGKVLTAAKEAVKGEKLPEPVRADLEAATARIAVLEAKLAKRAKAAGEAAKKTPDEKMQARVKAQIARLEGQIKQRLSACPI